VVGDKQTGELSLVIALDEAYPLSPWDYSKLVDPPTDMPDDGANVASNYRPK
jgi:hypothetical protein